MGTAVSRWAVAVGSFAIGVDCERPRSTRVAGRLPQGARSGCRPRLRSGRSGPDARFGPARGVQDLDSAGLACVVPVIQPPDQVASDLRAIEQFAAAFDLHRGGTRASSAGNASRVRLTFKPIPITAPQPRGRARMAPAFHVSAARRHHAFDQDAGDLAPVDPDVVGPLDSWRRGPSRR